MLGHHSAIAWLVTGIHAAGLSDSLLELLVAIGDEPDQRYVELYRAYIETQRDYLFYKAPQTDSYLQLEDAFESNVRKHLSAARNSFIESGDESGAALDRLIADSYEQFKKESDNPAAWIPVTSHAIAE